MIFSGFQPDTLIPLFLAAAISGLVSGVLILVLGIQRRDSSGIFIGIGALASSVAAFLYAFPVLASGNAWGMKALGNSIGIYTLAEAGPSRLYFSALGALAVSAFGIITLGVKSALFSSPGRNRIVLWTTVASGLSLVVLHWLYGTGALVLNAALFILYTMSLAALLASSGGVHTGHRQRFAKWAFIIAPIPLAGAVMQAAAITQTGAMAAVSSSSPSSPSLGYAGLGMTGVFICASAPMWVFIYLRFLLLPEKSPHTPMESDKDCCRDISEIVETQGYLNRLLNHDLHAPMGSLNNLLDEITAQIRGGVLPDAATLEVMQDVSRRSIHLLGTISDLGKYQLHRALPEEETLLLTPILWSSVQQLHDRLWEKNINIRQETDDTLSVVCDSYGLRRVIYALLEQAVSSRSGGSDISISSKPCPVWDGWVRITTSYQDEPWPDKLGELVGRTPNEETLAVDMNDRRLSLDMKLVLTICTALGWGFSQENAKEHMLKFHVDLPGAAAQPIN